MIVLDPGLKSPLSVPPPDLPPKTASVGPTPAELFPPPKAKRGRKFGQGKHERPYWVIAKEERDLVNKYLKTQPSHIEESREEGAIL